jgi:Putative Actinobacterial Holin-X, holin superfamily III
METKFETEADSVSPSSLVSGIIQDSRQLLSQQLTLVQMELKNDLRRTIDAAVPTMIGIIIGVLALSMFLHAAAYFLCWMAPDLPFWMAYAAVGAPTALVGLCLAMWGTVLFQKFNPLPVKSVEGLKENLEWKTKT